MAGTLSIDTYEKLITENLEWLKKQPRSLERDHIKLILDQEVDREKELRSLRKMQGYWRYATEAYTKLGEAHDKIFSLQKEILSLKDTG